MQTGLVEYENNKQSTVFSITFIMEWPYKLGSTVLIHPCVRFFFFFLVLLWCLKNCRGTHDANLLRKLNGLYVNMLSGCTPCVFHHWPHVNRLYSQTVCTDCVDRQWLHVDRLCGQTDCIWTDCMWTDCGQIVTACGQTPRRQTMTAWWQHV